jgi:acetyltransferase-like isoleucine patch superfamily enzyme
VCGLSVLPVVLAWAYLEAWFRAGSLLRIVVFSLSLTPSYIAFALTLMVVSPIAVRLFGIRTPANAEMRIEAMDWPLLQWVQYMVAIRIVRVFAGRLFCGSPIWTAYLRLNGARMGRGVYINTLSISDHNLLDFGDHVVIGADVHLSGHIVEAGVVKTAGVQCGDHVTVGLGSAIEIGVNIASDTQIGAMSLVPKHTRLQASSVYVGTPVRRL